MTDESHSGGPPAYDWQISVSFNFDLPHEQAEEAAGRTFTRIGDDDDSFEMALQEAAVKALKDPGSWLSQMIANAEPEIEIA